MELKKTFNEKLVLNYHLYKSIFLTLPFSQVDRYGVLLSVFSHACDDQIDKGRTPEEIVESFFKENTTFTTFEKKVTVLFKFIQFIERQVTIFDSLEDAYFKELIPVQGEGTLDYFLNLVNSEWKYVALAKKIQEYQVRIVLTAHPTQFYSVHVLGVLRRLTRAIKKKDNSEVEKIFKQLGKTHFYNREKVTPIDEAKSILVFLRRVFYHSLPRIEKKIEEQINSRLGESYTLPPLSSFIKIGFWPGGDRDGNPFVTHKTTEETAWLLKKSIIACYINDLKKLQEIFTFKGFFEEVRRIRINLTHTLTKWRPDSGGRGYHSFKEFSSDLEGLRRLLIDEHESLFLEELDFFIRKARCFGFYFATIDIRQDSSSYDRVIENLAQVIHGLDYSKASSKTRLNFLLNKDKFSPSNKTIENSLPDLLKTPALSEETVETLKTVEVSLKIQEENGKEGLHRYIISNTQSIFSVLQVGYFFSLAGKKFGDLDIDIIPLFETMDDLAKAGEIMESLYQIPEYRRQVAHRKERQTVMLGFSDGTKDGGYIAANLAILRAKETITTVSRRYGVKVIFFDGRGGPPARGGGETNKFYSSLGDKVENHEIQLTVQGQTVSSKYGNPASFTYNIEQLLVAGLEGHLFDHHHNRLNTNQRKLLHEMATLSYKFYSDLKNHPRFLEYLEDASPLRFYGDANIGSRPSKRVKEGRLNLSNLRAIPFVSSWSQMKQNIPAYYGLGSALKTMFDRGEGEKIIALFKESAFFRTLISNSIQALAKTDLKFTRHLGKDSRLGGIWKLIEGETRLSREMIGKLVNKEILFSEGDINRYSIPFRESIVTPLVIVQQYALTQLLKDRRKKNLSETERQVLEKIVIRSMPGLINASRNSA